MYVCHCYRVTDGAVKAAIEAGASDGRELMTSSRAGTRCGGCLLTLSQLMAKFGLDCSDVCRVDDQAA